MGEVAQFALSRFERRWLQRAARGWAAEVAADLEQIFPRLRDEPPASRTMDSDAGSPPGLPEGARPCAPP
jgi:hypothetical protein